jgi:4-carboxymuconolactone decarboxylase
MNTRARETYAAVMMTDPPAVATPDERATLEFVFGEVWTRPGLTRRQRRLVTLACVCGTMGPDAVDAHMYGALASGDLTRAELLEFVLHFAVYCGWPKASVVEGSLRAQVTRVARERGETVEPWPVLDNESLGPTDPEIRLVKGEECFAEVNLWPAPPRDTPYFHAGILNFVFGHVWQRPNLGRIDRRIVTIPCVGLAAADMPMHSHVGSALRSGDVSPAELHEIIVQYSAYVGIVEGALLQQVAAEELARIDAQD